MPATPQYPWARYELHIVLRVDSEDHYVQVRAEHGAGTSTLTLKLHGQSQLRSKTDSTSGSAKWWLFTAKQIKKHRAYHSWQLVFRNLADFMWKHDIAFPWHSIKLKSFSWNIWFISFVDGFHMKSAGFCEIHQISWNPLDFMNVKFWVITKYRSFFRKTHNKKSNMDKNN